MPLSNAERQARHRDRIKELLRNARSTPNAGTDDLPPDVYRKVMAEQTALGMLEHLTRDSSVPKVPPAEVHPPTYAETAGTFLKDMGIVPPQPAAPEPVATQTLALDRMQRIYSEAALREAGRVVDMGLQDLDRLPPAEGERGRFELEAWMQVFEKPPSEELLISVIEKAGANCGQALTVQTLFDILARAKSAKPPEVASQPVPKKRKRTVT